MKQRDGRIVIIGGYNCLFSSDKTDSTRSSVDLVPMNTMLVFDTKITTWNNVPQAQGDIPPPRAFHSAALMSGYLFFFLYIAVYDLVKLNFIIGF